MGALDENTSSLDVAQRERAHRLKNALLESMDALCQQHAGVRAGGNLAYRVATELADDAVARAARLVRVASAAVDTGHEAPPRVLTRENAGKVEGQIEWAQREASARRAVPKVGDLVKLKSGGPDMTLGVDGPGGVKCYWYDDRDQKIHVIEIDTVDCLKRAV